MLLIALLAAADAAFAEPESSAKASGEAPATAAEIRARMREVQAKAARVHGKLHTSRERALKQDPELSALAREIAEKQADLERRLRARHAHIAELVAERERLVEEHKELSAGLENLLEKESE